MCPCLQLKSIGIFGIIQSIFLSYCINFMSQLLGNLQTQVDLLSFDSLATSNDSSPKLLNRSSIPETQGPKPNPKNTTKHLYNWNRVEQRKYINFLIKHRQLFDLTNEQKKCVKINVVMSNTIRSRSAAQCHSHHQKMMSKFKSIEAIIKAHPNFIAQRFVPKSMRAYVNGILNPNQSSMKEINEGEDLHDLNSKPLWAQYADLLGYAEPLFPCETSLDF